MEDVHPVLKKKETVIIQLRSVPMTLHRSLTIAAMDAGKSLEQYCIEKLGRG